MVALLMGATLVAGMPLGIGLAHPTGHRTTAFASGLLLLGFCLVTGLSVGLLFLPSTILLVLAGALGRVEPRA